MSGVYSQQDLERHFAGINERLGAIEAQLKILSEKAGVEYQPPLETIPEDIVELARAGKKIEAVKRYREVVNDDPDEARKVVGGI